MGSGLIVLLICVVILGLIGLNSSGSCAYNTAANIVTVRACSRSTHHCLLLLGLLNLRSLLHLVLKRLLLRIASILVLLLLTYSISIEVVLMTTDCVAASIVIIIIVVTSLIVL